MRIARRSLFLVSVAAVFAAAYTPAQGAVLAGTGDPAQDVINLQNAAKAGGYWLLTGTFELGPTGSIELKKKVTKTTEELAQIAPFTGTMEPGDGKSRAYVCRQHACSRPVTSLQDMLTLVERT